MAAGLDGIAFTNHHRLVPGELLAAWNAEFAPFMIYGGIEITVREGEDVLVLGVADPDIASEDWSYPELHAFARARGGYLALAHPFRYRHHVDPSVKDFPPDAIELRSANTPPSAERKIRALARALDLRLLGNSDAHTPETLGCSFNLCDGPLPEGGDLTAYLRSRNFKGYAP